MFATQETACVDDQARLVVGHLIHFADPSVSAFDVITLEMIAKLVAKLGTLGFGKTALVIDGDALNVGFARASSNLESINLLPAVGANVYDIMRHETLVLTRAAVEKLEARFNG